MASGWEPAPPHASPLPILSPSSPVDAPLPPSTTHHHKYYLNDEMSIFLVEDRLFKVHRHFLARESEVFHWMFVCPPQPGGAEGLRDDQPIHLPDVKASEFERLLDFFYDGMYDHDDSVPGPWPDSIHYFEKWIDILSIATRFDFQRVRDSAINMIEKRKLDPVEKIYLAEKYDILRWLTPAYEALCQRIAPLEVHEAEKIGIRKATLLARAREAVRERPPSPPAAPGDKPQEYLPYDTSVVAQIVLEVFFPELPSKKPSLKKTPRRM